MYQEKIQFEMTFFKVRQEMFGLGFGKRVLGFFQAEIVKFVEMEECKVELFSVPVLTTTKLCERSGPSCSQYLTVERFLFISIIIYLNSSL